MLKYIPILSLKEKRFARAAEKTPECERVTSLMQFELLVMGQPEHGTVIQFNSFPVAQGN